jgi:hypothetical protein
VDVVGIVSQHGDTPSGPSVISPGLSCKFKDCSHRGGDDKGDDKEATTHAVDAIQAQPTSSGGTLLSPFLHPDGGFFSFLPRLNLAHHPHPGAACLLLGCVSNWVGVTSLLEGPLLCDLT